MSAPGEPLILVVEDAEDSAAILSELLVHHGFRVAVARNGAEALVRAHTKPRPDLVLLDLSLPLLDGWSVATALRSDTRTSAIPIVALTAHALPENLDRAHPENLPEQRDHLEREEHSVRGSEQVTRSASSRIA